MIRTFLACAIAASVSLSGLEDEFERIAADAHGRVGVGVMLLESGESSDFRGEERFPMHSVYKLPIAMAVLRRVDKGELKLDQMVKVEKSDFVRKGMYSPVRDKYPDGTQLTLAELLRYAVGESDGTASDVLLNLAGGPHRVMTFLNDINVSGLNVVDSEKEIGRHWKTQYDNWATPKGAVELLAALQAGRGLSAESQALLLKLMIDSSPGAKRLKDELPTGTVVAHKTGTGGTRDGITSATNDIGIITLPDGRHLAVAAFVSDSSADEATRESVIARTAKAAWDWATSARLQRPDRLLPTAPLAFYAQQLGRHASALRRKLVPHDPRIGISPLAMRTADVLLFSLRLAAAFRRSQGRRAPLISLSPHDFLP